MKLIYLWGFQLDQGVLDFKSFFVSTLPLSKKVKDRLFSVAKSLVDSKKKPILQYFFIKLINL